MREEESLCRTDEKWRRGQQSLQELPLSRAAADTRNQGERDAAKLLEMRCVLPLALSRSLAKSLAAQLQNYANAAVMMLPTNEHHHTARSVYRQQTTAQLKSQIYRTASRLLTSLARSPRQSIYLSVYLSSICPPPLPPLLFSLPLPCPSLPGSLRGAGQVPLGLPRTSPPLPSPHYFSPLPVLGPRNGILQQTQPTTPSIR